MAIPSCAERAADTSRLGNSGDVMTAVPQFLSANNAKTTLATGIGGSDTTIALATGTGTSFPSPVAPQYFMGTLSAGALVEIVEVTARSGDTLTVVRGQENTVAQSWPAGSLFQHLWTAGQVQDLVQWPMLDPILSVAFTTTGPQSIDLSGYAYGPDRLLVKMTSTVATSISNLTGMLLSSTLVTLYVAEGSSDISIPLNTPPFHISDTAAPVGWPGYPRSSLSLLYMPENASYKWIETGRSWRTS
jgi:hypothetical protein